VHASHVRNVHASRPCARAVRVSASFKVFFRRARAGFGVSMAAP
jgi:hypothetical protein